MEMRWSREKQVNFRTDEELFEKAKKIFSSQNLDVTNAINLFLEQTVVQNKLPFSTAEEWEKEKLIQRLREEMQKGMQSIENGRGISVSEARANLWNTK
jgi:addiction module RelB/DinJ family antitoxin